MRCLFVLLSITIVHAFNVSKWENNIMGFHSYCHIPSEGVFDLSASTNCIMDGNLNLTNPLTLTCVKCTRPIFIKTASQLDLKSFYKISLNQRKELFYPPFNRICRILFQGKNKNNTLKIAEELSEKFENNKFNVLGPSIAPIEKIKGMWRYHLLIKINLNKPYELQKFLKEKIGLDFLQKQIKGTKIIIDIDPISMI